MMTKYEFIVLVTKIEENGKVYTITHPGNRPVEALFSSANKIVDIHVVAIRKRFGLFTTTVYGRSIILSSTKFTVPIWRSSKDGWPIQFNKGFDDAFVSRFGRYFDPACN